MNYRNDWHTISAETAAKRLNVNPYTGLSEKEVRQRRKKFGKNRIWHIARMEAGKYILRTAGDLSTVLLIITAVLAFLFEESTEAVTMCVILALGAILRIVTYIKAKRILEENASENIPTAAVLRNGTITLISSADLVPGDIVLLHAGDTVPCDGRVISDAETIVTETGITENKGQIRKFNTAISSKPGSAAIPCESRPNMVFAGSMVLQGEIRMIATTIGKNALISMKQGGIEIPSGDSLPLIERLSGWCKTSELIMLAFVLFISVLSMFTGNNVKLEQVFFGAVSMAAASMSEYLTTIGYIIIAIAARSSRGPSEDGAVSRRGAVIKDCSKIEEIAAADSILLGDMSLLKSGRVSFNSFFANGEIYPKEKITENPDAVCEMLSLASEAAGAYVGNGALAVNGTESSAAPREQIIRRASELFASMTGKNTARQVLAIDRLNGSAVMAAGIDTAILQPVDPAHGPYVAAVSDIQSILRCCTTYKTDNGDFPLTNDIRKKIFTETARLEFIGAKVIAVSTRPSPFLTLTKVATLHSDMCFVGFFSLSESPEKGAVELIRKIKAANMRVLLFSDNPEHDLYYGHELGLFNKKTKIVSCDDDSAANREDKSLIVTMPPFHHANMADNLAAASLRYKIVREAGGKSAAFISQEPLDARSLTAAGCGIAVSRSNRRPAAQALKNQAQVIVYPDAAEGHGGFTEGVTAMLESRRAILNITNAARYLTASQLARLSVILLSVLFGITMPDSAAILTSGLLIDFTAVLVMAFEKAPENVLSIPCSPLPKYTEQAQYAAICGVACSLLCTAMPFLADWIASAAPLHPLKGTEMVSLLTASVFLSQLALSTQFMKRERLFRRGTTLNSAYVCYGMSTVLFAVLVLFEKHAAALMGGSVVSLYAAPLALIPALVLLVAMEGYKALRKK